MPHFSFLTHSSDHLAHNYEPLPVILVKGKGPWVWDTSGKRYWDFLSAYSALSFGHAHPHLLKALVTQAKQLALTSRAYHTEALINFSNKLCQLTGYDAVLPMNTGVEAVETAIKAMRRWGHFKKKIPEGKASIIVAKNNFHGRTVTAISASSHLHYQTGFGPLTPGFQWVPFGDLEAVKQAIDDTTCGVLIEPIQGEAGVIFPPEGYWVKLKALCQQAGILLIFDEVQSGLGRTGYLLATDHEKVRGDGVILGKALGGGLLPVSAFLANQSVMEVFNPGSHGSTFGGNPLAAAVGQAVLELLEDPACFVHVQNMGAYFLTALQQLRLPGVIGLRGRGLWVGMDIDPHYMTGHEAALKLMQSGVLTKETQAQTLRFAPPFIIQKKHIDVVVRQIKRAL